MMITDAVLLHAAPHWIGLAEDLSLCTRCVHSLNTKRDRSVRVDGGTESQEVSTQSVQTDDAKADVPSPGVKDVLSNGNGMRQLPSRRKEQEGTKGHRTQGKPPNTVRAAAAAVGVGGEGRTVVVKLQTLRSSASSCPRLHLLTNSPQAQMSIKHAKCSVYYHGQQQAPL